MVRVHPRLPAFARARPDEARASAQAEPVRRLSRRSSVSSRRRSVQAVARAIREYHETSMSQVTVSLPDGSTRSVPAGTSVREIAEGISPRLAKAALAGQVDQRLVDLDHRAGQRCRRPDRHLRCARSAAAAAPQHRAPAGGGRHEPLPRRPVRHRPGHRRRVLLRLRRPARLRARGSRRHREEDARDGAAGSRLRAADLAA